MPIYRDRADHPGTAQRPGSGRRELLTFMGLAVGLMAGLWVGLVYAPHLLLPITGFFTTTAGATSYLCYPSGPSASSGRAGTRQPASVPSRAPRRKPRRRSQHRH